MSEKDFEPLAEETLSTFAEIAENAAQKSAAGGGISVQSFASGNTLTGGQAFQNLENISQANRDALAALLREPCIARLLLEDEDGHQRVIYIARKSGLSLKSGKQLASYHSPIGRLAELPVGEEGIVTLQGEQQAFTLIEKTSFIPLLTDGGWDSSGNLYRHFELGTYSIESLRALLRAEGIDAGTNWIACSNRLRRKMGSRRVLATKLVRQWGYAISRFWIGSRAIFSVYH